MNDRQLRSDLIRLASRSTPEVRKALLPLLTKKAAKKTPVGRDWAKVNDLFNKLFRGSAELSNLAKPGGALHPAIERDSPLASLVSETHKAIWALSNYWVDNYEE